MYVCLLALLAALLAADTSAPDLAARFPDVEDGTVGFSYAVREGVSGNGTSVRVRFGSGSDTAYFTGRYDGEDEDYEEGPAHARVRFRRGRVVDLDVVVGGSGRRARRADRDLGVVPAAAAGRWFLAQVAHRDEDLAEDAILGAAIARDVEVVEPLLAVVRGRDVASDVRSTALHWLVVFAGERVFADLAGIIDDEDEDDELREHAVFALSQLDEETALPLLMEIARDHRDPRLRRTALFALSQFDDSDEVVMLLEEILTD